MEEASPPILRSAAQSSIMAGSAGLAQTRKMTKASISSLDSSDGDSISSDVEKTSASAAEWGREKSAPPAGQQMGPGAAPRQGSSRDGGGKLDSDPEKGSQHRKSTAGAEECDIHAVPVPGARAPEDLDLERGGEGKKTAGGNDGGDDDDSSSEEDGASDAVGTGLAGVVSRVLSRTTTRSSWNPGPPPDGGSRAWITVLCAHLVIMTTWGFINTFAVFQSHYVILLSRPPSDIAWIGSIQVFLIFFIGTFSGRATDAGYFRVVFSCGAVLQIVGIFATAQCTQYWQFLLSQGVVLGLADGLLFCPMIAVVSTYFQKKRALVLGIVASGTATGGLLFPGMVRVLLPKVGLAWSLRAIGFFQILALTLGGLGVRPRVPGRKGGPIVEWAAFKETEYALFGCGSYFCFWGVYVVYFYIVSFARDVIHVPFEESLNLLLIVNGVGIVGRIIPNFIADRVGAINMYIVFAFGTGVTALCWQGVHDIKGLYAYAVMYGLVAAGIQSLFPAGLASLTSDVRKTGVRLGMVFTIVGFSNLTGPPIAGALISKMGGSYVATQAFAGATVLLGCSFMVASRYFRGRRLGVGLWAKV